ncbi:hypothetical protein [Dyella psychrodurans]|nr:hypothetical protein [Dyella psychrodurans]
MSAKKFQRNVCLIQDVESKAYRVMTGGFNKALYGDFDGAWEIAA